MPWTVLDCSAYRDLSMHARALLFEVARQFVRDNNGSLLLSRAYMTSRGWNSADMLTKAKRELLEAGFIYETVKGQRPNKASWYAVTWRSLDPNPKYDAGAVEGFKRGAYAISPAATTVPAVKPPKPSREQLYERWASRPKNEVLGPSHGTEPRSIGPPHGTEPFPVVPPHGTNKPPFGGPPVPPHGHPLEKPSAVRESAAATT